MVAVPPKIKILLIEDKDKDSTLIRKSLSGNGHSSFDLDQAQVLNQGLELLTKNEYDAVLIDLDLPDSQGLATFVKVYAKCGDIPIIVLSESENSEIGIKAVHHGAQDYILKGELEGHYLSRVIRYAIQRQFSEKALKTSAEQFRSIVSNIPGAIYRYRHTSDGCWTLAYVSDAIKEITGYPASDLIREAKGNYRLIIFSEDAERVTHVVEGVPSNGHSFSIDYRINHADGSVRWVHEQGRAVRDELGQVVWIDGAIFDTTEQHRAEERVRYLAYHDVLTDLPNRLLFMERLDLTLKLADRNRVHAGIIILGLDHFKRINDTLGHARGDLLLKNVADRLRKTLGDEYFLARTGGDEFALLIPRIHQADLAHDMAKKVFSALSEPFGVDGQELFMNCSMGVGVYPEDAVTGEALFKKADMALHVAKEKGRNNFQFYSTAMDSKAATRLELEHSLRRAVERQEFRLLYQPQLDLRTGEITGAEALVRWQHPTLGLVSPVDFIPIAEETGLIVQLGEWVLHTACTQNKHWQKLGFPPLRIAVNLSARQFQQTGLIDYIARVLARSGVNSSNLELELTESIIMQNVERTVQMLRALHAMGVKLSIDDFGTGYSSLSYLKRFPLSTLKIDRSFVHDITTDPDAASIAKAIISMAHSLKLEVVAEGVETDQQLTFLRSQNCDKMQGFLFSKPVPAQDFEKMLLDGKRLPV